MPGRSPAASSPRSAGAGARVLPLHEGGAEESDHELTEGRSNCSSGDADGKVRPSAGHHARQLSDELEQQSHQPSVKRRLEAMGSSRDASEQADRAPDHSPTRQRRRLSSREPSQPQEMQESGLDCLAEASAFQDQLQQVQQENQELRAYSGYLQKQHKALAGQVQRWRARCTGLEAEVGTLFKQLQQLVAVGTAPTMLDATSAAARLRALGPKQAQPAQPAQPRQALKPQGMGPPLLPQRSTLPATPPQQLARQHHQPPPPQQQEQAPARPQPLAAHRPAQLPAVSAPQRPASNGANTAAATLGGELALLRQLLSLAGPEGAAAAWAAVQKAVSQPQPAAGSSHHSHLSPQEQRPPGAHAHPRAA